MLLNELKLMAAAYKKISAGIIFLALFCMLISLMVTALPSGALFAPFTVGVVDNDNSAEVTLMLEILAATESLSKIVAFERLEPAEAAARLDSDQVPAYIIVPPGFSHGIMTGENPPLTLVGNESRVIQLSVTKLLVGAGIAYLTTSQSGIYSALDYAAAHGMSRADIDRHLVMPINIEYMKALLAYNDYFESNEVSATGGLPRGEYYLNSAFVFLVNILLITIIRPLLDSTAPAVMRRYRMCGIPVFRVLLVKWLALCLILITLLLPATAFYGAWVIAAGVWLGGLGLMCSQLFRSEVASGLFLFSLAVITMFAAGGALTLAYLPPVFGAVAPFMPNYWFIHGHGPVSAIVFCAYGTAFFGVAIAKAKAGCVA